MKFQVLLLVLSLVLQGVVDGQSCQRTSNCSCDTRVNKCQDQTGFILESESSVVCQVDGNCFCDNDRRSQTFGGCLRSPSPVTPIPSNSPSKVPSKVPSSSPTFTQTSSPTGAPSGNPSSSPSKNPTLLPTSSPSKTPTLKPVTSSPSPGPSSTPSDAIAQCGAECPEGASGNFPSLECLGYIQCARGSKITSFECPAGTLFDETLQVCNWDWAVNSCSCSAEPPASEMPTYVPTQSPTVVVVPSKAPTGVSLRPSRGCAEPEEGCGWGIWNVWTCQCDCAPGFCLSSNQQCYDGCTTHLDFNPFGGCIPGYDCPWYPDPSGKTFCVSTVNISGQYNIHRSSTKCCEKHFSYLKTEGCVGESEQSVEDAKDEQEQVALRPDFYYPDIYGRDNCIHGNGYYEWMMALIVCDDYLFPTMEDCCSKWYPAREDCPDLSEPTDPNVNGNPYPVQPKFYPHQSESNCRFGRNYPQWMAQESYVQEYLFTTPDECCETHYPAATNCPLGPDDGVQEGRYWQSDIHFYPYQKEGAMCALGNDYPEWMGDPTRRDTHLFETGGACCNAWFNDQNVTECELNIIETIDGYPVGEEPEEPSEWWPTLAYPYDCTSEGSPPSWMLSPGFTSYYIFDSKADCCSAHYCTHVAGLFH